MSELPKSLDPFRANNVVVTCPEISERKNLTLRSLHMESGTVLTLRSMLYQGQESWWRLARDRVSIPHLRVELFEHTGVVFRVFDFTALTFVSYSPFGDLDYGAQDCVVEAIQYRVRDFTVTEVDTNLALEGDAPA